MGTVIDIVDLRRVLIDGPRSVTGVNRQVIKTDRLNLTDIVVEGLSHGCKITKLQKAWKDQEIMNEWLSTAWAYKLDKKRARAEASDFDRFKLMIAKNKEPRLFPPSYNLQESQIMCAFLPDPLLSLQLMVDDICDCILKCRYNMQCSSGHSVSYSYLCYSLLNTRVTS